jgi:hypothetical protein
MEGTLMTKLITPDDVIDALAACRAEAEKGITAQYEAELQMSHAVLEAERLEAQAFLEATGTVADRTAMAKVAAAESKAAAEIARARYNRVRTKLKQLELTQTALQTQARMVEITWRL